jgi:hypothetical protein
VTRPGQRKDGVGERARRTLERRIPASRLARLLLGLALLAGGLLGFLPVLGFWMIPLGLFVLSYDVPAVARLRRRAGAWWRKRRGAASRSGRR